MRGLPLMELLQELSEAAEERKKERELHDRRLKAAEAGRKAGKHGTGQGA